MKRKYWSAENMAEKIFFRDVTGNRLSGHYARNIYLKVTLKITVSLILATSKIPY